MRRMTIDNFLDSLISFILYPAVISAGKSSGNRLIMASRYALNLAGSLTILYSFEEKKMQIIRLNRQVEPEAVLSM